MISVTIYTDNTVTVQRFPAMKEPRTYSNVSERNQRRLKQATRTYTGRFVNVKSSTYQKF